MRKLLIISIAAALAGGGAYAAAGRADHTDSAARDQAEFAKRTAGMVAGKPVSCVSEREVGGNRSIGPDILFENKFSSKAFWINHPRGGCPELRSDRALRWKSTINQLCRGDIVDVFDPVAHIPYGSCALGDFTPYTRG